MKHTFEAQHDKTVDQCTTPDQIAPLPAAAMHFAVNWLLEEIKKIFPEDFKRYQPWYAEVKRFRKARPDDVKRAWQWIRDYANARYKTTGAGAQGDKE